MLRAAACGGFARFCERYELPYHDAAEFRQRYVIDALVSTIKAAMGG